MKRLILFVVVILCLIPIASAYTYATTQTIGYNLSASEGAKTDYQVRFILSNLTGVSGKYGTDNIIYTNGTTRGDWADINITDNSDTPLSFWLDNATTTVYNITMFVKVPLIAIDNSSKSKIKYGNASQTIRDSNGTATFMCFDDFSDNNYNANPVWTVVSGTWSAATGALVLSSDTVPDGITTPCSAKTFELHVSFKKPDTGVSNSEVSGMIVTDRNTGYATYSHDDEYDILMNSATVIADGTWIKNTNTHIAELTRDQNSKLTTYLDGVAKANVTNTSTTSFDKIYLEGHTNAGVIYDTVYVKNYTLLEPSIYFDSSTTTSKLISTFTSNATAAGGTHPLAIQFTDTSSGTPTTWNWSWGDGTANGTTQNPVHIFNSFGAYTVNLTITNATGNSSLSSSTKIYVKPNFIRSLTSPILTHYVGGDNINVADPQIISNTTHQTLWYGTYDGADPANWTVRMATSPLTFPPNTWTRYPGNPILINSVSWEGGGVRFGSLIQDNSSGYRMWYNGATGGLSKIGLATSTNGYTWTKYPSNPIFDVSGDETSVENPSIINDSGTLRMYYNYRTAGTTLPGIRYAESTNGITWTKYSGDVVGLGSAGSIDSTYIEHHQIFKYQGIYWLVYECYNGTTWRNALAYSTSHNGTFTKMGSILDPNITGTWDSGQIATPFMYQNPGSGEWNLLYQGGLPNAYSTGVFDMGIVSESSLVDSTTAPVAAFSANATTGGTTLGVQFTDSSNNTPTSWKWAYKNASVGWTQFSTSQNPTYTFPIGTYDINLTATNAFGSDDEIKTSYITVIQTLPVSSFTSNITNGTSPVVVQFNDTSSTTITTWNWSARNTTPGNNTPFTFATEQNPVHRFTKGNWSIALGVTNISGSNTTAGNYWVNVSPYDGPFTWEYNASGTYIWTCPEDVTRVSLQLVGGGGSGRGASQASGYKSGYGGSAGSAQSVSRITVIPGQNYTIVVGNRGENSSYGSAGNAGSASSAFGTTAAGGLGGLVGSYGNSTLTNGAEGAWSTTRFALNGTNSTVFTGGISGLGYGAGGGGGGSKQYEGSIEAQGGYGAGGYVNIIAYGYGTENLPDFSGSPTTDFPGSSIKFTDLSTIRNATDLNYLWNFGDGTTSTTSGDVNHVYSYTGSYTVSLALNNTAGDIVTETKNEYITIVAQTTTFSAPRTVSLICTDYWNNPIPGLTVNVTPLNATMPEDWLIKYYGFGSGVTLTTTGFSGITGSDGSWAAPMSESILYQFNFSGGGITPYSETFYPSQLAYFIRIPTGSVYVVPTPASNYISYTIANVTINSTHEFFNVTYRDTSGGSPNLTFSVKNQSGAVLYTSTVSGFGTSSTSISSGPLVHGVGDRYTYSFTAPQNQIGNVTVAQTIYWEATGAVGLTGFPTWTGNWIGIGLLVVLAATFSFISKRFAMIIIPLMGLLMMVYMRWITPSVTSVAMLGSLIFLLILGILMYIREGAIKEGVT
jgi:PKD repeat protein